MEMREGRAAYDLLLDESEECEDDVATVVREVCPRKASVGRSSLPPALNMGKPSEGTSSHRRVQSPTRTFASLPPPLPRASASPSAYAALPPPVAPARSSQADADAWVTAPEVTRPSAETLAPRYSASPLRLLPLWVGLVLGVLLTSSAFAALERSVAGLRVPETVAIANSVAADRGVRTAGFELKPSVVVAKQPQRARSAFRGTRVAARRASTARRGSKPSKATSFAVLTGRMRTCAAGQSGTARLEMTVQPSGLISHAVVYGRYVGPEGSCMAQSARGLRLRAFEGPARRVQRTFSW